MTDVQPTNAPKTETPTGSGSDADKDKKLAVQITVALQQCLDKIKPICDLITNVTVTINNAKKKIENMPHAKKELNPLWGLLSEPLAQILAAVGLLLSGVLGLVGRLLNGLGLGGLVDNLLSGLGLKSVLNGLGAGSLTSALTGKK
ncbi:late embryogenesis abundant protein [Ophiostoma piceae UAMH 11346]|uniref:Late embryogenesis abundant protein n=1 Tax=Ophiostoma piceae (strain UAMH 11346) TaxID=1262450 RepID=S3C652_OPHP1|nr:late embryogenesis abundant protein [Ophiostoma piceae UAMH 11346]